MKSFRGDFPLFENLASYLQRNPPRRNDGSLLTISEAARLLKNLRQVAFELDPSFFLRVLNPSWHQLTGYAPRECLGSNFLDYVYPRDRGLCREYFRSLTRECLTESSVTIRIMRRDEASRWVILRANQSLDQGKKNEEGSIVGTLADVTLGVQKEKTRHAHQRSLDNLINYLPAMICRRRNDKSWTMEYASEGSRELLGYEPEELINNRRISYNSLLHPEDQERLWDEIQAKLREDQQFELTYRVITADKEIKWVFELGRGVHSRSGLLLSVESVVCDATHRHKMELLQQQQALYDEETKLPNFSLFVDRLQQAALRHASQRDSQQKGIYALLMVGIDKPGQAPHGELPPLDLLVHKIGKRLHKLLQGANSLARLERDKFGVLLEEVEDFDDLIIKARSLQEQVQVPTLIGGQEYRFSASIGIAVFGSGQYQEANLMMIKAHTALGRAQALGGGRYEILDTRDHSGMPAASTMNTELKYALEQGELLVYWDPVVAVGSGGLAALEARLIWLHRRRGLLRTEQFVPALPDSQLLVSLWEWMLHEINRQLGTWQHFGDVDPKRIRIQISAATRLDIDSILHLGKELFQAEKKIQPFELTIGLSGHILSQDTRKVRKLLDDIKKRRNVHLLLWSFDLDSNILLRWREYIDYLGLEQDLLNDSEENIHLAPILIRWARDLSIKTILRNSSDAGQFSRLSALGIDYLQGNLSGTCIEPDRILQLLENQERNWLKLNLKQAEQV